LIRVTVKALN